MLPLWTDAYLADTTHLDLEHHGAYFLLMMKAWRMSGEEVPSLPDDDMFLRNTLSISQKKWQVLKPYILEFWTLKEGRWTQKRLSEAWEKDAEYRRRQSEAGKASARKLEDNDDWRETHRPEKTQQKQQNEGNPAEAEAEVPITNVIGSAPKKKRRRKKPAKLLPDDWKPKPLSQKDKTELNLSPEEVRHEFTKFKAHAAANERRQVNWQASWRLWLFSDYGTYGQRLAGKSGKTANGSNTARNKPRSAGLGGAFERELEALQGKGPLESYRDNTPSPDDADGTLRLSFDDDA